MSPVSQPVAEVAAGLGTILSVWAHPDDEAYLAGGIMAAAVDAGAGVVCVTATHGERGTPDPSTWPPARLSARRDAELAASLALLGVSEHIQLGYPDGGCAEVPADEAVDRLAALISDIRPDTVLTFGPDGVTGHPDHRTVSGWTTAAVRRSDSGWAPRLLYAAKTEAWCGRFDPLNQDLRVFPPGLPASFPAGEVAFEVVLSGHLLDRKLAALAAQSSQVAPTIETVGEDVFRAWIDTECFRPAW
jgi:LmbE family N-acetylglucosaminyl deacetylase